MKLNQLHTFLCVSPVHLFLSALCYLHKEAQLLIIQLLTSERPEALNYIRLFEKGLSRLICRLWSWLANRKYTYKETKFHLDEHTNSNVCAHFSYNEFYLEQKRHNYDCVTSINLNCTPTGDNYHISYKLTLRDGYTEIKANMKSHIIML